MNALRGIKFFRNILKVPPVQHSFCSKFLLPEFSISTLIKYSWDMCCSHPVVCVLMNSLTMHFIISIDLTVAISLIAETADVLSIWIRMWRLNSFLHNVLKPNLEASNSKILMCCWFFCWECPPVLFWLSDAPSQMMGHQDLLWQMGFPWQWRHRHQ